MASMFLYPVVTLYCVNEGSEIPVLASVNEWFPTESLPLPAEASMKLFVKALPGPACPPPVYGRLLIVISDCLRKVV
jgi:hypothetical protein